MEAISLTYILLNTIKCMIITSLIIPQDLDAGNLTERWQLKARCPGTFDDYLKRGFPQLRFPQQNSLAWKGVNCYYMSSKAWKGVYMLSLDPNHMERV